MKYLLAALAFMLILLILRFGELYSQVGRYQTYWNRLNQQPAQKNEILYIALGDSTAQAIGARKPQQGYVGIIAKELSHRTGRPVRILNFSKTGAGLSDVIERQVPLLQEQTIAPDTIITMEIGANDMDEFDSATFESQINDLMAKLPQQTVISDIPYFGASRRKKLEIKVEEANVIMDRLARKHGFRLASLHERMRTNSGLRTLAIDGFHPSTYSYNSNWAPAFMERIEENLKEL